MGARGTRRTITAVAVACLLAAVVMSNLYFSFVSDHVYQEGVTHLSEVYEQVDHNLCEFIERTWNNLDDWHVPLWWGGTDCAWMYQLGLDPVFADTQHVLRLLNAGNLGYPNIAGVESWARWLRDAAGAGWMGSGYKRRGWDDLSSVLGSGEAAMVWIWDTWFDEDFVAGRYGPSDFALMPVFSGTTDKGSYEGGTDL